MTGAQEEFPRFSPREAARLRRTATKRQHAADRRASRARSRLLPSSSPGLLRLLGPLRGPVLALRYRRTAAELAEVVFDEGRRSVLQGQLSVLEAEMSRLGRKPPSVAAGGAPDDDQADGGSALQDAGGLPDGAAGRNAASEQFSAPDELISRLEALRQEREDAELELQAARSALAASDGEYARMSSEMEEGLARLRQAEERLSAGLASPLTGLDAVSRDMSAQADALRSVEDRARASGDVEYADELAARRRQVELEVERLAAADEQLRSAEADRARLSSELEAARLAFERLAESSVREQAVKFLRPEDPEARRARRRRPVLSRLRPASGQSVEEDSVTEVTDTSGGPLEAGDSDPEPPSRVSRQERRRLRAERIAATAAASAPDGSSEDVPEVQPASYQDGAPAAQLPLPVPPELSEEPELSEGQSAVLPELSEGQSAVLPELSEGQSAVLPDADPALEPVLPELSEEPEQDEPATSTAISPDVQSKAEAAEAAAEAAAESEGVSLLQEVRSRFRAAADLRQQDEEAEAAATPVAPRQPSRSELRLARRERIAAQLHQGGIVPTEEASGEDFEASTLEEADVFAPVAIPPSVQRRQLRELRRRDLVEERLHSRQERSARALPDRTDVSTILLDTVPPADREKMAGWLDSIPDETLARLLDSDLSEVNRLLSELTQEDVEGQRRQEALLELERIQEEIRSRSEPVFSFRSTAVVTSASPAELDESLFGDDRDAAPGTAPELEESRRGARRRARQRARARRQMERARSRTTRARARAGEQAARISDDLQQEQQQEQERAEKRSPLRRRSRDAYAPAETPSAAGPSSRQLRSQERQQERDLQRRLKDAEKAEARQQRSASKASKAGDSASEPELGRVGGIRRSRALAAELRRQERDRRSQLREFEREAARMRKASEDQIDRARQEKVANEIDRLKSDQGRIRQQAKDVRRQERGNRSREAQRIKMMRHQAKLDAAVQRRAALSAQEAQQRAEEEAKLEERRQQRAPRAAEQTTPSALTAGYAWSEEASGAVSARSTRIIDPSEYDLPEGLPEQRL